MTPDPQQEQETLETRIQNLSEAKRELLGLLLQQEHEGVSEHAQSLDLVAIQPFGGRRPLFCLPPVFGVAFPYYHLAAELGMQQPLYAVQPRGWDGQRPHARIEDMAAHAIEAIRTAQAAGPYNLAGYSFGGLVAFEAARQLHEAGHAVGLVALIDTWAPLSVKRPGVSDLSGLFAASAREGWRYLSDALSWLLAARSQRRAHTNRAAGPKAFRTGGNTPLAPRAVFRIYLANMRAWRHYAPLPYPARVALFQSSRVGNDERDHTRGWAALAAAGVEVHHLPGDHISIMRPPHAQALAKALSACLGQGERRR